MNADTRVAAAVVGSLVLFGLWMLIRPAIGSGGTSDRAFFYDTQSQEIFIDRADRVPPFDRAGHEVVRAYQFTCGTCDEASRFVGYYEKFVPAFRDRLMEQGASPVQFEDEYDRNRLISEDGKTWHPADSQKGQAIQTRLSQRCGESSPRICHP